MVAAVCWNHLKERSANVTITKSACHANLKLRSLAIWHMLQEFTDQKVHGMQTVKHCYLNQMDQLALASATPADFLD